jgi:hypothetical protein
MLEYEILSQNYWEGYLPTLGRGEPEKKRRE